MRYAPRAAQVLLESVVLVMEGRQQENGSDNV